MKGAYPVAREIRPKPSSGKVDGVQDPVAMITSSALSTVPSLHSIPIILLPPWSFPSAGACSCRSNLETLFPGRTFPFKAATSFKSMVNAFPASTHPPSKLRYPAHFSKDAVATSAGKQAHILFPSLNSSHLDPKAISFLYDSKAYEFPIAPVSSLERPITITPDLECVKKNKNQNLSTYWKRKILIKVLHSIQESVFIANMCSPDPQIGHIGSDL